MRRKKSNLSVGQSKNKGRYRTSVQPATINNPLRQLPTTHQPQSGTKRKLQTVTTHIPPKRRITTQTQTQTQSQPSGSDGDPSPDEYMSSTSAYSDDSFEDENHFHEEEAFKTLSDPTFIRTLIRAFLNKHLLRHFMVFVTLIVAGKLEPDNIAVLLALERSYWQSLSSTTQMRFHPVSRRFWCIVMRICKGKGLRFFSGHKNFGQIINKEGTRGNLDPDKSVMNFAVPTQRYLRHVDKRYGKILKPGIINDTLSIVKNKTNLVLMADLKRISPGHRNFTDGDVNLWGHEPKPTLQEKIQLYHNYERCIDHLRTHLKDIDDNNDTFNTNFLMSILHRISLFLQLVKEKHLQEKKRMAFLIKKRLDSGIGTMFKTRISLSRTIMYCCQDLIKKGLSINDEILRIVHEENKVLTSDFFNDELTYTDLPNWRRLKPITILEEKFDLDDEDLSNIIPQRSDRWKQLRSECPLTASSLYNALGLRGRDPMMAHYNEKYNGQEIEYDIATLDRMQHGRDNEVNGVATFVHKFLPARYGNKFKVFEEGMYFMDGNVVPRLCEASPDGRISYKDEDDPTQIKEELIEVKCPTSSDYRTKVFYKVPRYYLLQVLCQMAVTSIHTCWLVCWSDVSSTIFEIDFDEEIWDEIWTAARDIYDKQVPTLPRSVKRMQEHIFGLLDTLIDRVVYHGEISSVKVNTRVVPSTLRTDLPYERIRKKYTCSLPPSEVSASSQSIMLQGQNFFNEVYHALRETATEMLAIVLTDGNRKAIVDLPQHLPIAYGLKGSRFPMSVMRSILADVRDKLYLNTTFVLCEVFDGQFITLVCRADDGRPTTTLQLQRDLWNELSKTWSKRKLLATLKSCYVQHTGSVPLTPRWVEMELYTSQQLASQGANTYDISQLDVTSVLRGSGYSTGTIQMLAELQSENSSIDDEDFDGDQTRDTEENSDYLPDLDEPSFSESESDEDDDRGNDSDDDDTDNDANSFEATLHRNLQGVRGRIDWQNVNTDDIITNYLRHFDVLNSMILTEINCILNTLETFLNRKIYRRSLRKAEKINVILTSVGNIGDVRPTKKTPETLRKQAEAIVMSKFYPKMYLVPHVFRVKWDNTYEEWKSNSPVEDTVEIFNEDGSESFTHTLCYMPGVDAQETKPLCQTTDPSHIFTNVRSQISRHGYTHVSRAAFLEVSDKDHNVLPRSILVDQIDRQNTDFTKRFFSIDVEECLKSTGNHSEAEFVKLFRNWFEACDTRGIPPFQRLRQMQDLYEYMEANFKVLFAPPKSTYNGMPFKTIHMIMQSISCRFLLTTLYENKFNHRAISTLGVETFFSDLTSMEISGLGCAKSVDLPSLMSHVTQLNAIRHNEKRGFEFETSWRQVYPIQFLDTHEDYVSFDRKQKTKKRSLKSISGYKCITRGMRGIREFHKVDESKILAEDRSGIPADFDPSNVDL